MPLAANGKAIEDRIQQMRLDEPGLRYGEICRRTDDLGAGYVSVDERVLNRARNGENIQEANLKSIAKVLGLEVREIVAEDQKGDDEVGPGPGIVKTMTAISAEGAPAVNAEEGATVSISINTSSKD